jgi:DNA-binding response OmpR family regulator
MEILLVEDNAGDTVLIRQILSEIGEPVNLHIARDGEQALTMIGGGYFEPELIILDLNIPRITGVALMEKWRSVDVPVVVFSSSLDASERERVLALGAREFVGKPTKLDAYVGAVRGIIERWSRSKSIDGV